MTHDSLTNWQTLKGGSLNDVSRSGDVIKRPRAPDSDSVVQVLQWLTELGFTTTPEVIEVAENNIYYKYIEGEPLLRPWRQIAKTEEWLVQVAQWLKSYHTAIQGFELKSGAKFLWGPEKIELGMIVCHGDLGPWNFLEKDGKLTGVIDWDLAYYGSPLDDLTAIAIDSVPLRKPKEGSMEDASHEVLRKRLEVFVNAYGDITVDQLLFHVHGYYDWLIKETKRCGDLGIEPLAEFVRRDSLAEYVSDRDYIKEKWISNK
jgi:tRNA A-37 threonylcarbamoyl transferase component Bud32